MTWITRGVRTVTCIASGCPGARKDTTDVKLTAVHFVQFTSPISISISKLFVFMYVLQF